MSAVNALIFDEVMRNVSEVADVFAADGAARLERQSLDRADFDRLADAGLIRTGLPVNRGGLWQGSRANVRDYVALYRRLAGADPSVALVSTMHPRSDRRGATAARRVACRTSVLGPRAVAAPSRPAARE